MDEKSKQYRRDLLTAAICDGGLRDLIAEGLEHYGPSIVAIVACTRTDPGRTFLRSIGKCAWDNVRWQRDVRESLALHRAASVIVPASTFMPIADSLAQSLTTSLRDLLSRPGIVPTAVMGGGGTMTAAIAAAAPDGTLPQALADCNGRVWAVASPTESPASRERRRRADRVHRHGMN
jgi:hypothetical protein